MDFDEFVNFLDDYKRFCNALWSTSDSFEYREKVQKYTKALCEKYKLCDLAVDIAYHTGKYLFNGKKVLNG